MPNAHLTEAPKEQDKQWAVLRVRAATLRDSLPESQRTVVETLISLLDSYRTLQVSHKRLAWELWQSIVKIAAHLSLKTE